jgi:hypothetical protein
MNAQGRTTAVINRSSDAEARRSKEKNPSALWII